MNAATFGWLCVETSASARYCSRVAAATFGWLCVETVPLLIQKAWNIGSHLRVAVC